MRRYLVILFVFILAVNQASAVIFEPNDIEWISDTSGTLHKGGTLSSGNYTVKAAQFPSGVPGYKDMNGNIVPETEVDPMVYLEVYKKGVLLKEFIMTPGSEPYSDPDYEIRISTTDFTPRTAREWVLEYYDPWVTVSIQKNGFPKLEVIITTDKSIYTSNNAEIITAKVEVKNSGDAFLKNVDVDLNIGELKLRGGDASQLHNSYPRLNKGESKSFEVILVVPDLIDERLYTMSANTKGYNVREALYSASTTQSITVSPKQNYFGISKAVRDRIYLNDYATVRITIANGGMYDIKNIHVTDNLSDKFVLSSSPTPFAWDIPLLKPGEEWGTGYSMKPTEANIDGWTIPAASATFTVNNKPYSASTSTVKIIVNGPIILLNKTVSKSVVNISEDVTVTVSVNNVGNIGTKTDVKDSLIDDVNLVSGQLSQLNFSEPKKAWGFSYIIRMNKEGVYELPSAIANYTNVEYRGFVHDVKSSERPIIKVVDPNKPILTPAPNATGSASLNPGENPQSSPGDQGTPSQTSKQGWISSIISNTPGAIPTTGEPTPTPITPGFEISFAVLVLIFATIMKRR